MLKKIHGMILSIIKRTVINLYLKRYIKRSTLDKMFEKFNLKSA